jgi:TPR repeat protein
MLSGFKTSETFQRKFSCRSLISLLLAGCLALPTLQSARADFTDGLYARDKLSMPEAIRIWRENGWQEDDFLSQMQLGDIYSNSQGDTKYYDPIEAYVWYYLASINDRIPEHLEDRRVRRVISNHFYRALDRQDDLLLTMDTEAREEARRRIVYIMGCRGSEGFVRLGQLYSVSWPEGPSVGEPNGPAFDDERIDDIPDDSPDTRQRLDGVWRSMSSFRTGAFQARERQSAHTRRIMGIPDGSLVVPADTTALIYFRVADNMGHPLARYYIRGIEHMLRKANKFGARTIEAAAEKARNWALPFEFYPTGDNPSGLPYTDECYLDVERRAALSLVDKEVPPRTVLRALWFLGWYNMREAYWPATYGPSASTAIKKLQITMGNEPTGRLSPREIIRVVQMAALRGDAATQNALGVMYTKGVGVRRNFPRAEYWFKKAADQRYAPSLYHLGVLYKVGPDGIHQDLLRANDYFTASALAGFRPTMNQLGYLLAKAEERRQEDVPNGPHP